MIRFFLVVQLLCGVGQTSQALGENAKPTRITAYDQIPVAVQRLYQNDCYEGFVNLANWQKIIGQSGSEIPFGKRKKLYLLPCEWSANSVTSSLFLVDGKMVKELNFPYQDDVGAVVYLAGLVNSTYEGDGVFKVVDPNACKKPGDRMADYAKLKGEKLFPFVPARGGLICTD